MALPLKQWQAAREDYIGGGGSFRLMAMKHGLNLATLEKRARREGWAKLRRERDEVLRTGTTAPAFAPAYAATVSASEPTSEAWLEEKRRNHFLETEGLIEYTRAKVREKLEGDGLGCNDLARIADTLDTLTETEARVLSIRDPRKDKPQRRQYPFCRVNHDRVPVPESDVAGHDLPPAIGAQYIGLSP